MNTREAMLKGLSADYAEQSMNRFEFNYESEIHREYLNTVRFISGEWGVTLPLLKDESRFKTILEKNGAAVVYHQDIISELGFKYSIDSERVRLIDAENFSTISTKDYEIFKS